MISSLVDLPDGRPLNVLCLGAHCDDIEIGCGGTLLEMAHQLENTNLQWIVFSSDATRQQESRTAAGRILKNNFEIAFHTFRDGFFPDHYGEIKDEFEKLKSAFSPDIVFTHYREDRHQDHRIISEITASTFRSHLILEYEIPKYDDDLGNPSVFVPLSSDTCNEKAAIVVEANVSQHGRQWFSEDTFLSLMRLRGIQCNSSSGYAEAFYCRKMRLSLKDL